jgi:hypothetical protein
MNGMRLFVFQFMMSVQISHVRIICVCMDDGMMGKKTQTLQVLHYQNCMQLRPSQLQVGFSFLLNFELLILCSNSNMTKLARFEDEF